MVYEVLEAERETLEAEARRLVELRIESSPRAFETYEGIAIPIDRLRELLSAHDLDDEAYAMLRVETGWFAVEYLRKLEQEGRVLAFTSDGDLALRKAMRSASHPLLRLLADSEFGAAVTVEAEAALEELATLPGWDADNPQVRRYPI